MVGDGPGVAGYAEHCCIDLFQERVSARADSDRELGVSTAAMVYLAAASPQLVYAIDSRYPEQVGDVITNPIEIRADKSRCQRSRASESSSNLDEVEHYNRVYLERGAVSEFYDPRRPEWVRAIPNF